LMKLCNDAYRDGYAQGMADEGEASRISLEARERVLLDFVTLVEDEIIGVKTGKSPSGVRMRDVLGQWESTIREAKELLNGR